MRPRGLYLVRDFDLVGGGLHLRPKRHLLADILGHLGATDNERRAR
jgi:hypothetical protein